MSKPVLALIMFATCALNVAAQQLSIRISLEEARATIEGRLDSPAPSMSFLQSYAGVKDLPGRISSLKMADADRQNVEYKRVGNGEFVAERGFVWFTYRVDLRQGANILNSAHTSWANQSAAMFALDDLLPQPTNKLRAKLTLELPAGWRIISNEDHVYENILDIHDAQRAVIFVGKDWRVLPVPGTQLRLALAGDTQVPDATAAVDVAQIYGEYIKLFGSPPAGAAPQIAVVRPSGAAYGSWEAETRGSTVSIVTGGGLGARDAEQRLQQQLRHELFHLWIPNGIHFSGNYDWFYEGFATYVEQKLGVAMNQIRFIDLLATLGRAYDIDRYTSRKGSLVDASSERWSGTSGQLYARGMLVAFLCDVAMLDASKGKASVEVLLRHIFEAGRSSAAAADGNESIVNLMRSSPELKQIADDYVTGSKAVDWSGYLKNAGLEAGTRDQLTSITVLGKPTSRQKDLLDKLGYNSWKKLAPR